MATVAVSRQGKMRVQAPPARRGASARRAAQARASAERQAEPVSAAAVGLAAAAAVAAGVEAPTAEAKEVNSYAGLSPCKDSKAFEKREKNEIRSINRKLKKYDEGSAPAIALEKSLKQTEDRFQAYRDAGLLCGGDGLPHLIVDGNRQHLGEFVVPGIGFLYISGWIGWAGREYVRENKENSKKPTEGEIIIDVPMALRCARTALVWPVRAIKELRSGKLLKANVTVSPRKYSAFRRAYPHGGGRGGVALGGMASVSASSLTDLLTKHKPAKGWEGPERGRSSSGDGEGSANARVVIVSNRLPVRNAGTAEEPAPELDEASFLAAVKRARPRDMVAHFVGQVPPELHCSSEHQQDTLEHKLRQLGCTPVFLPESVAPPFYEGMCKDTLWPLLHYVMPLDGSNCFRRSDWQSYVAANRQFVDAVVREVDADRDLVLVNDYHLFPLPTLLRKHFHAICCGFFLHSPFPSSELLRAFPMREAILRGMLNADLVGFHVYDYARHFLSCCSRILGVQHEIRRGQIELDVLGRLVRVKILPVGVSEQLAISLHSQLTQRTASQLASTYSSRRLLLSIDDLDGFKGLDLKLEAFERMLESTPVPGVCLLQAINPSHTSESEQTAELRKTLHSHAERINRRFGTPDCPAIEVVERKLDSNERIALYSIASAYVLTAVRDGLNLHPYEYVFCREHVGVNSTAIVSEFVGCSPSLSGALRVNPWNTDATSEAMRKAVTMGEQERTVRHQRNYRYVSQHTCEHWARQLVNSLADVTESLPRKRNYGLGFGLNFKVVSVSEKFKRLDHDDVARAFSNCARAQRAVFLDYDGTLTSQGGCSMDIPPPAEVMNALRALTATADVTVCIVSGRDRGILDEWFHDERLALAAEHGQFIKPANSSRWQRSVEMVNSWQDVAVPIMQSYQESTDGSSVHVKESAAAWHFSDADPDFGNWQAKELTEHLLELIGSPMEVVKSSTTVEIKPRGVSKGLAVSRLLASIEQASGPVGCVVALGDDRSDEDMFTALDEFAAAPHHKTRPSAYSCTVGQKPSHASFYVDDNAEVLEILQMLASRHAQEQCRDSSAVIET